MRLSDKHPRLEPPLWGSFFLGAGFVGAFFCWVLSFIKP